MKTKRKLLNLKKIQIAKINSFSILGKGTVQNSTQPCTIDNSRTPKGGRKTLTDSYQLDCETGDI
ncbi:hypothetical protein IMCC3317_06270 [Kordia antarctica]|uniref:Uncharacterized protein n=1 Tax=Kordia antarctica TaxID=1218801 RepID=A0A7L4ZFR6_9FLAO|nr:hypothetical protein [Kordia antarctica]QHI35281.1 hypothetical protein IMCC3317_06270 [Kordia antarctica]